MTGFPRSLAAAVALAALAAGAGCARADDVPPLGPQTYAQTFAHPTDAPGFAAAYPGLATWGYFGNEPLKFKGVRMTQAQRFTSRAWPGTLNAYIDADYCPGAKTPAVADGALRLTASRFETAEARAGCGQGRAWGSSIVTSQPSFSQAFGYFEAEARVPCDPGRWSAFWLLPKDKTRENAGRLAEIDVFEHYGGPITVQSGAPPRPFVIDRVGKPFSTLHSGVVGAEAIASNAQKLPQKSPGERDAFCRAFHRFGVLWTPAEFRFYIDRRETFRTPNPGVSDPHYWVLNLDVGKVAGDPDAAPGPSTYEVRSVKAWALTGEEGR